MSTTVAQPREDLRHIPLSSISVKDGFNPRGEVADDAALDALAATLKARGMLQPLRVRAVDDGYELVAGERRYRAAIKASLMEVPAVIERPEASTNDGADAERLADAIVENDQRLDIDPLARALAYGRLKAHGLTIKGIAERVGHANKSGLQRVRDHLAILKLPESVQAQIGAQHVPMHVVPALNKLAEVHPGLAELAVQRVLAPTGDFHEDEPITWAEVVAQPLTIVSDHYDNYGGQLPDGVYAAYSQVAISGLPLDEKATKNLAALNKLLDRDADGDFKVRLEHDAVESARALGATHSDPQPGSPVLIVGADVVAQIAGDAIARQLKWQREQAKARKDRATQAAAAAANGTSSTHRDSPAAAPPAEETAEQRDQRLAAAEAERQAQAKAKTEQLRAERAAAESFNDQLGAAVFKGLSKVRVDDRVLKVLTAMPLHELAQIAQRGARYGMPGWVTTETSARGKTKRIYLERTPSGAKASEYLAGATTAGEIAGRTLALLVMAVFADERAVAQSSRSFYGLRAATMPWTAEVDETLDALVVENLGNQLLAEQLADRAKERAAAAEARKAVEAARAELADKLPRLGELTDDELDTFGPLLIQAQLGWMQRSDADRALAAERKRRRELAEAEAVNVAMAALLTKLGDELGLTDLNVEQLDEMQALAADSLDGDELAAVTAAIDAQRTALENADARPTNGDDDHDDLDDDDEEADQTS